MILFERVVKMFFPSKRKAMDGNKKWLAVIGGEKEVT
jgi:hypothetical protein